MFPVGYPFFGSSSSTKMIPKTSSRMRNVMMCPFSFTRSARRGFGWCYCAVTPPPVAEAAPRLQFVCAGLGLPRLMLAAARRPGRAGSADAQAPFPAACA